MAKKDDLLSGFGNRIKDGGSSVKNESTKGDETTVVSDQEKERRTRYGRKAAETTESRLGDTMMHTSLRLDIESYDKIREIARRNGLPYSDLINYAIKSFVEAYEAKNGLVIVARESRISIESLI